MESRKEELKEELALATLRICLTGCEDTGKTTLTGVLSEAPGVTDDGHGSLRKSMFNFQHERENGRTTSIRNELIGFDILGSQVVIKREETDIEREHMWPKIVNKAHRVVKLIDTCGHERYLKTTAFGLTTVFPHYNMLVISAEQGITRMTMEHLNITRALKLPTFIVVTKIDLLSQEALKTALKCLVSTFKDKTAQLCHQFKQGEDLSELA